MRLIADREACVGSGQCALAAPNVFDQSDADGRVLVTTEHPDPADEPAVLVAVESCPARALSYPAP
jgi:ferredoxin